MKYAISLLIAATLCACSSGDKNHAPTISAVTDQLVLVDNSSDAIAFTISDRETDASQLTVTARSDNPMVLPDSGMIISGSADARTITLNPVAGASGVANITLTVSDAKRKTAKTQFRLMVNAAVAGTTLVRDLRYRSENSTPVSLSSVQVDNDSEDEAAFADVLTTP